MPAIVAGGCLSAARLRCLMLLVLLASLSPVQALKCLQDGDPGTTLPRKDLAVEPNETFSITCIIDPDHDLVRGFTSEDLYFTHDSMTEAGPQRIEVPRDKYTVLNSTALLFTESLEVAVHYIYTCRVRKPDNPTMAICLNVVDVGYPPLPVENFRCISYNWQDLNCSWDVPYNAVKTKYELQYRLKSYYKKKCIRRPEAPSGQPGRLPEYVPHRPGELRHESCVVNVTDFRIVHERFRMEMNASNALGAKVFPWFQLETYAIVLPAPPENVTSEETETSVKLRVKIGYPMDVFPRRLKYAIDYVSRWDPEPQSVNTSSMTGIPTTYAPPITITDLRPYTNYTFRVRMRSSLAVGEDMWSEPTALVVRTVATIPSSAPTVDVGSFELVGTAQSRSVYVYWHQIPAWEQNGPNFTYCVSAWSRDGALPDLRPSLVTEAYAKFDVLPMERTEFYVNACNQQGYSDQHVSVTVPSRQEIGDGPHSVMVTIGDSGGVRLSWEQGQDPHSFTVFWCEHTRDRPFQCQGQLHWEHVPGDRRQFEPTLPPTSEYQFAVASNYRTKRSSARLLSSGMVWSRCTKLNGEMARIGEMKVERTDARRLTLAWNNVCSGVSSDYVVYFCPAADNRCLENETRRVLKGQSAHAVTIEGLQPYTVYRISVALITGAQEGQRSKPLVARTSQARPDSPPVIKQVVSSTNTSLTVVWSPPDQPNGQLVHYRLYIDGQNLPVIPAAHTRHTIQNLTAYTKYSISMEACNAVWKTVGCSPRSKEVVNFTLPGVPGAMEPPQTQLLNTSAVRVRWRPPALPGGPRPLYFLHIFSQSDGENRTAQLQLPADVTVADVPVPACEPGSVSQRHLFRIRAAVRLNSSALLPGPWSDQVQQNCVLASDWPAGTIALVVVGGALLMAVAVLLFFCLCSRTKRKLDDMRNIEVKLPSGLDRLEKPPLSGFAGSGERRPAHGGGGTAYGRLVPQTSELNDQTNTSVSGQPLLQEDLAREECDGDTSEMTPPVAASLDNNSCTSSATNYTDSGAECEKAPSPTYEKLPWLGEPAAPLSPYVQVAGPESGGGGPPGAGAAGSDPQREKHYAKFSPYIDARAIQALMARSMEDLPSDGGHQEVSRSVPDLTGAPEPYSRIGHRSSTGYVSMASDDTLPAGGGSPYCRLGSPPPPQSPQSPQKPAAAVRKVPELRPYVTLGPPPGGSDSGFPPYVLAGPPAPDAPPTVGSCSPARPAQHPKLTPVAPIELRDLQSTTNSAGYVSKEALEPVLSPKKLPTVASARDPYCRVVTSHHNPPDLGPNVSMV